MPNAILAVYVAAFAFVAWDQSYWWRTKEDYGFGWLVPLFGAYVLRERWNRLGEAVRACLGPGAAQAAGWRGRLVALLAWACLLCGVLFFLAGAWYRASLGASHMGTLLVTLGAIAMAAATLVLYLKNEYKNAAPSLAADRRLAVLSLCVFPLCVWLLSAPLLSGIENALNRMLLGKIMSLVSLGFGAFGIEFRQEGNVLVTAGGRVGVLDACSGIRSLLGCLFAGSFLGAVLLERLGQKLWLLAAAAVLAFSANLLRAGALAWAVHRHGVDAVEGAWHDFAGWAVLLLTFAGLALLVRAMRASPRRPGVSEK